MLRIKDIATVVRLQRTMGTFNREGEFGNFFPQNKHLEYLLPTEVESTHKNYTNYNLPWHSYIRFLNH